MQYLDAYKSYRILSNNIYPVYSLPNYTTGWTEDRKFGSHKNGALKELFLKYFSRYGSWREWHFHGIKSSYST